MNVQIFYHNPEGAVQIETWECATNAEALWLADDVCRKGLLIEAEDVKLIPAHRVVMVSFVKDAANTESPRRKENEMGMLLRKWRAVAAEPCPAGKKCTLLPRLVKDLEKMMEG